MNPERARWNEKHRKGGHDRPSVGLIMVQGRLAKGRALDLAGGAGDNAAVLALAGWRVTLLDLSDEALARARRRAAELRADVHLVQGDALRLPLRGPFETIVVSRFLERAAVPELLRLLTPGGTLYAEQPLSGLPEEYLVRPGELPRIYAPLETLLDMTLEGSAVFIGRKR